MIPTHFANGRLPLKTSSNLGSRSTASAVLSRPLSCPCTQRRPVDLPPSTVAAAFPQNSTGCENNNFLTFNAFTAFAESFRRTPNRRLIPTHQANQGLTSDVQENPEKMTRLPKKNPSADIVRIGSTLPLPRQLSAALANPLPSRSFGLTC